MRLFLFTLAALLAFCLVAAPAAVSAFWALGHSTVMQIAYDHMSAKTRWYSEEHFRYLAEIGPFEMGEPGYRALTGANWMDSVKRWLDQFNELHYKDTPINPFNVTIEGCPIQHMNGATALPKAWSSLHSKTTPPWVRSFAIALGTHITGDLHQMMHDSTLIMADHPGGDAGGNLITVWVDTSVPGMSVNRCKDRWCKANLHKAFDSICFQDLPDINLPLETSDRQFIEQYAANLTARHASNITEAEIKIYDAETWAQEGWEQAKQIAYGWPDYDKGQVIPNNATIPKWYQDRCIPSVERSIVLAGLRLARQLNYSLQYGPEEGVVPDWPFPSNSNCPSTTTTKAAEVSTTTTPSPTNSSNNNNGAPSGNTTNPEDLKGFGGREAAFFFGGFATALFIVGIAYLVWRWKFSAPSGPRAYQRAESNMTATGFENEAGYGSAPSSPVV